LAKRLKLNKIKENYTKQKSNFIMTKKTSILLSLSIILMFAPQLCAEGFSIFELGARAATLGGAFVARVDDASAIYYNPAGLAYLKGFKFKLNLTYDYLTTKANTLNPEVIYKSSPIQIRGSYYLTWHLSERFSLGLGAFVPYLGAISWPWNWPGRPLASNAKLDSYYIRPVVAVKVIKGLVLGLGLDFVSTHIEWMHAQPVQAEYYNIFMDSRISVKGNGTGFVTSLLWKINEKLHIGAKYQHKVSIDLEGDNLFYNLDDNDLIHLPNPSDCPNPISPPTKTVQNVFSHITMPTEVVFGFFYAPADRLGIHLDFKRNNWSQLGKLEFMGGRNSTGNSDGTSHDSFYQSIDLSWKDTWKIMFGLEYRISQFCAFRTGYSYHKSAVRNSAIHPASPDFDQNTVSFGFGYEGPFFSIWDSEKAGELSFDVYFQYVISDDITSSLPVFAFSYDADRWIVGVGIGLGF